MTTATETTDLAAFHADTAKALATFSPADAAIEKMRADYLPLTIAGLDDRAGYNRVHDARMVVKNHRVAIEKKRKELKADALEYGRRIDGEATRLTDMLVPIEQHLEAQEKRIDDEKARIKAEAEAARKKKLDDRMLALGKVGVIGLASEVAELTDEAFAERLRVATEAHAAEQERKRLADVEAARVAAEAETLRKAEEARVAEARRQEEARAAEARRAEQARMAEQQAALDRQRAEQAEAQRKLDAERAEIERQRAAAATPHPAPAPVVAPSKATKVSDEDKLEAFAKSLEALTLPDVGRATASKLLTIMVDAASKVRALAR